MHMLDIYPQQVVRTGIQDAWKRSPVSLETCGTPGYWKQWKATRDEQLDYILDQALRWHVISVNIKSDARSRRSGRPRSTSSRRSMGYRFVLRRFEYPATVKAGRMMPVTCGG